jgi:Tfp pilus assembly protein PilF
LPGEALVSLAPGDPEVHLALAQVYQIYRQTEKAFGEYRATLRLEANEPDYYRQYGEALEQEKRYGDAQESFRKMLEAAKEDSTRLAAVAALARIHLQQDRLAELTGEFQRRIRNTPKKLAAYEELAAIYKESGQIARGVEILESGLNTVDDKSAASRA